MLAMKITQGMHVKMLKVNPKNQQIQKLMNVLTNALKMVFVINNQINVFVMKDILKMIAQKKR